ncbi:MAG: energy transducer TonB [Gammaproteobacteria bacterium]|nr:energy transducer TonB [Gammaproteobacteria bacterium]MDE0450292.1 energy transducer TonB [Gammaproteobacteria bacterium]
MKYRAGFISALFAMAGNAWADETIRDALRVESSPLTRIEVQIDASEFPEAAAAAEQLVEEIEDRSHRHDIELAQPLMLLGDARLGMADVVGALDAYDRSLLITRVNKGLFTPEQVEAVYREATAYAALGNREVANDRHEYAFNIMVRAYGNDDPKLIPGLFTLADWYNTERNIFLARRLLGRAVLLGKRHLPADDPQTIRALKGLARTFREERFPTSVSESRPASDSPSYRDNRFHNVQLNNFSPGERALIEVINIEMAKPEGSDEEIAGAMLELADWYLLFEKYNRAFPLYTRIWELLESDPEGLNSVFRDPTPLYLPLPPPPIPAVGITEDGVVELALTVSDRGLVSDLSTLRSEPEGMMEFKVRKATRRARYRPAFVDALPVPTEGVRVEYRFPYKPDEKAAPAT